MKLAMGIERHQSPTLPVMQASIDGDESLECNALILMADLEQLLAHLANPAQSPSEMLILEYLTHITNQIIAFAERLPGPVQYLSLETFLGQAATLYTQQHGVSVSDGRLSIASLSANPKALRGLRNDILRVIHIYLNIFALTFNDTPLRERWSAHFKGFHDELATTVNALSLHKFS